VKLRFFAWMTLNQAAEASRLSVRTGNASGLERISLEAN
jgi:hypothetical protein